MSPEAPITPADVLKPLQRIPREPGEVSKRTREFVALLLVYRAKAVGSRDYANPIELITAGKTLLSKQGVKAAGKLVESELQQAGYYKATVPPPEPESAESSAEERRVQMEALRPSIQHILAHSDPLELIGQQAVRLGYGGDPAPVKAIYGASTTRLLVKQVGKIPAHIVIKGPSSGGKSFDVNSTLVLLPTEAYVKFPASTPRALIYSTDSLQHRTIVFGEIDSIPVGDEGGAAASAIRNVLEDGELVFTVVEKDEHGQHVSRQIRRPGPTQLITTSTKGLHGPEWEQFSTRVYEIELVPDLARTSAILTKQSESDEDPEIGLVEVDPAVIAFGLYLQLGAPWKVAVPFAGTLIRLIAKTEALAQARVTRDYAKLMAFIKGVAVIRHAHRGRTPRGAVVATLDDYETARELLTSAYVSALGISPGVKAVVDLVRELSGGQARDVWTEEIVDQFPARLPQNRPVSERTIQRWVGEAVARGWVQNRETRPYQPWRLTFGRSYPRSVALPSKEALQAVLEGRSNDDDTISKVKKEERRRREEAGPEPMSTVSVVAKSSTSQQTGGGGRRQKPENSPKTRLSRALQTAFRGPSEGLQRPFGRRVDPPTFKILSSLHASESAPKPDTPKRAGRGMARWIASLAQNPQGAPDT